MYWVVLNTGETRTSGSLVLYKVSLLTCCNMPVQVLPVIMLPVRGPQAQHFHNSANSDIHLTIVMYSVIPFAVMDRAGLVQIRNSEFFSQHRLPGMQKT